MVNLEDAFFAAKSGDRDSFDQLLGHYHDNLTSFVGSRLGEKLRTRVDVNDVVQESALRAFRSLESVSWRGETAFRNWLFSIAIHVIHEQARRFLRWGEATTDRDDVPDDGTSPTRQIRRQERFDRLEAAIERLSDDHREVIKMTRIDGIPVREVAARMDRSEKATYQLLWRATQKLKEIFGDTASLHLPEHRRLGDESPQP